MTGAPLLEVRDLHVSYGSVAAVNGVSFAVGRGQVVALVGANGAGKTTTLRAISGMHARGSGTILVEGSPLKTSARAVLDAGIAHSPEGRQVFPLMTVRENLQVGAHLVKDRRLAAEREARMVARFPVLGERLAQSAGTLSGGEQQMLAMARALMTGPSLLLLDEPTMGLAPIVVGVIRELIEQLSAEGTSILLVEESADLTLRVAEEMHLMDGGRIVLSGPTGELVGTEEMRRLYLGGQGTTSSTSNGKESPQ
ncbi:MAG: ABC transporter ATP-binding protein [Actinobacteria bacterium]|nr:ABC transporter ATP-binding protein [Actinomycetota bacterium]